MTRRVALKDIEKAALQRGEGYYDVVVAAGVIDGEQLVIEVEEWDRIATRYVKVEGSAPAQIGVGTELKNLLSRLGIVDQPGCKCDGRAREMDRLGLEWCQANEETILGWLHEEARRRGLPFSTLVARAVLRLAYRRAARASAPRPLRERAAVTPEG
jgi:hypothetical protein